MDFDFVVYAAGFSADKQAKERFGEDHYLKEDYLSWALTNTKRAVTNVLDEFPLAPYHKIFLTGKNNYRDKLATRAPYKGNRDPTHKPRYFKEIRDYLVTVWNADVVEGREADDAVGVLQYAAKDKSTCIVSIDKDHWCIPGWILIPAHKQKPSTLSYNPLSEADRAFYLQVLTGDRVDNVPGIKGVGPKTAQALLPKRGTREQWHALTLNEYKKAYASAAASAFHETASLIWIQREDWKNYDGSSILVPNLMEVKNN